MNEDNKFNLDKELGGSFDLESLKLTSRKISKAKKEEENKEEIIENIGATEIPTQDDSTLLEELSKFANEAEEQMKSKEAIRQKVEQETKKNKENNKYIFIGFGLAIVIIFIFVFSGIDRSSIKGDKRTPANIVKSDNEFAPTSNSFQESNYGGGGGFVKSENTNSNGFESNPM